MVPRDPLYGHRDLADVIKIRVFDGEVFLYYPREYKKEARESQNMP